MSGTDSNPNLLSTVNHYTILPPVTEPFLWMCEHTPHSPEASAGLSFDVSSPHLPNKALIGCVNMYHLLFK